MNKRRVVITGIGVVAPNGIGIQNFWDSLVHGRSAVRRITYFNASSYPCQVAAEALYFDPLDYMDSKTVRRLGRFAQFTFAAARMAVEESQINFKQENPYKVGVFIGTAIGGVDFIETQHTIFMEKGLRRISPYTVVASSTHSASGIIGCAFNLRGPNTTISAGCNSGLDAVLLAFNAIRLGDADVMVVGAGEAPITPYIHAAFCASGNMSCENNEPKKAVKPYDMNADGLVLGEGGAVIIMEEVQHALERKANIYGEVLGYALANEALDLYGIETDNGAMAFNFNRALNNSNIEVRDIDYICAHGNGMLSYDIDETEAIKKVFGEIAYEIPVTSIKPITGHGISVTGIWQTITSVLAIKYGIIPPTINLDNPDPRCDLNYAPHHFVKRDVKIALINAHGFGGRLTTLIVRNFLPGTLAS